MLDQSSLNFLRDLAENNDREWFHSQKARYEQVLKTPFEAFVGTLIEQVQAVDPTVLITPRQAIFRIYRDTRFSANKAPYKTHVSAIISPFGTRSKEYPGFYIHLEAEKFMLGGGAYFLEKETLQKVREAIAEDPESFMELVEAPSFVKHYGQVLGEQNKRLPADFKELVGEVPILANKQFYYMAELPAKHALGAGAVQKAMDYYKTGKPLSDYLAQAIS